MNFSDALIHVRAGNYITRSGWCDTWIGLQVPDEYSKMTLPYLYLKCVNDDKIPWTISHVDVLADDWVVV